LLGREALETEFCEDGGFSAPPVPVETQNDVIEPMNHVRCLACQAIAEKHRQERGWVRRKNGTARGQVRLQCRPAGASGDAERY
jgi:hypothetical protein